MREWLKRKSGEFIRRENSGRIGFFDHSTRWFLVVAGCWFVFFYVTGNDTPSLKPGGQPGWLVWHDQGAYSQEAADLSQGALKHAEYWIGYPILAAPFWLIVPRHPFLVPDLLLVLVMAGAFFCSCRFFISRLEAWILVAIFIFFEPILRDKSLIIPWNTLPAFAAIYLCVYLLIFSPLTWRRVLISAAACFIAVFARPTEAVPLGAIFVLAVVGRKFPKRWWAMALFVVALAGAAAVTAAMNFHMYGKFSSPYVQDESTKFSWSYPALKLYQLICDGTFLTGNSAFPKADLQVGSILDRFPYFLLALPGVLYLIVTRGWGTLGLPAAIAGSVLFYLLYDPLNSPAYFWTYGSYHYFWWIIPWLAFLSYLSVRQAPFVLGRRVYWVALLAPVLLYALAGFKAVETAASDAGGGWITVATDYRNQVFTITVRANGDLGTVEDARVLFSKPPPYFGSAVDSEDKLRVLVNGRDWSLPQDFMFSQQQAGPYDVAFLEHGLTLRKGDTLTLLFNTPMAPELQRVSLLHAQFSPAAVFAHHLSR